MKRMIATLAVAGAVALASLFLGVIYTGPHMKEQPHLRSYQYEAPPPPAGTVPVEEKREPTVTGNGETLTRGAVYYRYYCVFCHGETGAGNGPVGQSYLPAPADLRAGQIGLMSDDEILMAMATGAGHDPLLRRVVPPGHRSDIARYVRTLSRMSRRIPER